MWCVMQTFTGQEEATIKLCRELIGRAEVEASDVAADTIGRAEAEASDDAADIMDTAEMEVSYAAADTMGTTEAEVGRGTAIYERMICPKKAMLKKYRGEWKKVDGILFPGYVFIKCEDGERLKAALYQVPKLTKLLGADGIGRLTDEEEIWLGKLIGLGDTAEVSVGFIEGDKLIVTEGPLVGQEAFVKRIARHKRIAVVEAEMFGRMTEMTLGLEVVRKV